MEELMSTTQNGMITSLELVKQINIFREIENNSSELRHDNLRAIIKDEFEEEILSLKIQEKPIASNGGRPTMVFELTLSQAKQVLVRESKFVRKAIIAYIESLESKKLPTTYLTALEALVATEKQRILLEQEIQVMKPKAEYFDALVDRNLLTNFRTTAKELQIGEKKFIQSLIDKKYLYRGGKGKLQPYAPHVTSGLFEVKEFINQGGFTSTQTLITPKGRETFRLLCKEQ